MYTQSKPLVVFNYSSSNFQLKILIKWALFSCGGHKLTKVYNSNRFFLFFVLQWIVILGLNFYFNWWSAYQTFLIEF